MEALRMPGFSSLIADACRDFVLALNQIPENTILSPSDLYAIATEISTQRATTAGMPGLATALFVGLKTTIIDDAIVLAHATSPTQYYEAC